MYDMTHALGIIGIIFLGAFVATLLIGIMFALFSKIVKDIDGEDE